MLSDKQVAEAKQRALRMLGQMNIVLTQQEQTRLEIVDFGLNDLQRTGVQFITYESNERYCARHLIFFPRQTIPQHMHPKIGDDPGKMETFRVQAGQVFAYTEGERSENIKAVVPKDSENYYTVHHQTVLNPGEQITIAPPVYHWFQAGDEGAVVIEFSSACRDEFDRFTDPRIKRS